VEPIVVHVRMVKLATLRAFIHVDYARMGISGRHTHTHTHTCALIYVVNFCIAIGGDSLRPLYLRILKHLLRGFEGVRCKFFVDVRQLRSILSH
jgi:hypothetical protein